ncbi:MAG: hypothetical protein AB7H86_15060 [Blastocatellales bacterium]
MRTRSILTLKRSTFLIGMILLLSGIFFSATRINNVEAAREIGTRKITTSEIPVKVRRAASKNPYETAFDYRNYASSMVAGMLFDGSTFTLNALPASGSNVAPGAIISYSMIINNPTGSGDDDDVVLTMLVPTGTSFVNLVVNGEDPFDSCEGPNTSGVIVCNESSLDDDNTIVTLVVQVNNPTAAGAVNFSATYDSDDAPSFINRTASHVIVQPTGGGGGGGPTADLSIVKTGDASVIAGGTSSALPAAGGTGNITYNLAIQNGGPSNASPVFIFDQLPNNTQLVSPPTLVSASINGVAQPGFQLTCAVDGGAGNFITCRPGNNTAINAAYLPDVLPAGFQGVIRYRVRVPADVAQGTIIQNVAVIQTAQYQSEPLATSITPDPNSANNVSTGTSTEVQTLVDLEITKATNNATPINGGAAFTYNLVVTNHGPSDAENVVVTDPLPQGIVLANANISVVNSPSIPGYGLTCVGPPIGQNGTVTCSGNLPGSSGGPTSTATITLVVQAIANQAGGVRTNTATVTSSTQEASPNTYPNTASVQNTLTVNAPLSISKQGPALVAAGDTFTYKVSINNGGQSTALNATIQDPLPANTTYVSHSGTGAFANGCSHNGGVPGTIVCSNIDIPTGMHDLNITVKLAANAPTGNLANTATITSAGTGTIGVGSSTSNATVQHRSDLEITKTAAPSPVIAGTDLIYTIQVKNNGISDLAAGEFVVSDTPFPPTGTSLVGTITAVGFSCNGGTAFPCTSTAALPAGATATISFKVKVDTNYSDCQPGALLSNTATVATVGTDVIDPNASNNTSTVTTPVTCSADLGVAKTATPVVDPDGAGPLAPVALPVVGPNVPAGSVNAGGYIRYDVPFGNAGPSDAVNVMLTDVVPANTAFVGALATGGIFVPASQPPANPFNFTIQATDTVAPNGPNVSLACTVSGAPGSQQITCRPSGNTGLTPAYPDGNFPAGYQGTLTFFVKVNESVTGGTVVDNGANITSAPNGTIPGTADPNTGNNTTLPIQTVVIASSNLTVTKIVQSAVTAASNPNQTGPIGPATAPNGTATTGTAVLPGTYLTYRVTISNNGPSDVSNIRLTDILPAGLSTPPGRVLGVKYISVNPVVPSGATFTCAPPTGVNPANNPQGNGGSLVCTAPLLSANAPNNTAAIDITVFIDPATKTDLVNTAVVDATLNNFNRPVSGTATLTTPVAPTSDIALTKTHTPDPVIAGTDLEYTITMTNNGPSTAQMVSLVDTIPAYQAVKSIQVLQSPDGNGAPNLTCTPAGNAAVDPRATPTSVTCTAAELPPNKKPDGTVNPAGTVVVKIVVRQSAFTPQPFPGPEPVQYQNCVTATSMSTDPVAGNSTNVCDTVNVIFRADLSITKTDSPDPVIAGTNLTYTIEATNNGPSAALNMMISDPIPAGTVFVSAAASAGATLMTPAVNANGVVKATWDAAGGTANGFTGPGVKRTLTIVVRVCPEVTCNTILSNTATTSSLTPDPNPANNSATETTTVQAQSDLMITKSGPSEAPYSTTGFDSIVTYTLSFSNKGPSNAAGTKIVDVLPKGFEVVETTSTVPGTIFSVTTVNGISTVTAELGILGAANQCATNFPTSGTVIIRAKVPIKHPVVTVINRATISTTNCLPDPNLADNTSLWETRITMPGLTANESYPADTEVSDQQPGSILFYPIYTSDAVNSNIQNARISLTNVSQTESVCVHLFAVDGSSCSVLDAFVCLTPNQTTTFLASDFDPGNTGYLMAVAVDCETGLPRAFNCLIGDEYVKFASGHEASLGAESIQAVMMFPGGTDPNVTTTDLIFDGMFYNRLPRVLVASNVPSPADGNSTMLILNRVGGDFQIGGATIGPINGLVFDDAETSYSFTANLGNCQSRQILSNNFPRTFTPFSRVIPAGRSGWMKFWAVNDRALLGSMINYNPQAKSTSSAFNQGHNLHKLTLSAAATIRIPVFIPSC